MSLGWFTHHRSESCVMMNVPFLAQILVSGTCVVLTVLRNVTFYAPYVIWSQWSLGYELRIYVAGNSLSPSLNLLVNLLEILQVWPLNLLREVNTNSCKLPNRLFVQFVHKCCHLSGDEHLEIESFSAFTSWWHQPSWLFKPCLFMVLFPPIWELDLGVYFHCCLSFQGNSASRLDLQSQRLIDLPHWVQSFIKVLVACTIKTARSCLVWTGLSKTARYKCFISHLMLLSEGLQRRTGSDVMALFCYSALCCQSDWYNFVAIKNLRGHVISARFSSMIHASLCEVNTCNKWFWSLFLCAICIHCALG